MISTQTPASVRWAVEARRSRRRLYPTTVVYLTLGSAALVWGARADTPVAIGSWLLGVAFWTWLEYVVHRYVLHGVFPDGPGLKRLTHRLFDHLHVQHHLRPWDGNHVNGTLKDTAPFLAPAALLALFLPPHTLLAFLAGLAQAYVVEEWVHHSVHFYHFDNLYFRYIKRHHLYHHSQIADGTAFGLTTGMWDAAYGTRIPEPTRRALYGRGRASARAATSRAARELW